MTDYRIRNAVPADAPALADCIIEPIVAAFSGRVPEQCLRWLTRDESITNWRRWFDTERDDGKFLLVAEHEADGVIGLALAGPQPADEQYPAELYVLGVLPEHQGRGVGRALFAAAAARLRRQGLQAMRVQVLAANPNCAFYERLGGVYLSERPYDWNGIILSAFLYGWTDTGRLVDIKAEM